MKLKVRRMSNPRPRFLSLVDVGAARKAFRAFKADGDASADPPADPTRGSSVLGDMRRRLVEGGTAIKRMLYGLDHAPDEAAGDCPTGASLVAQKIEDAGLSSDGLLSFVFGKGVFPEVDDVRGWMRERAFKVDAEPVEAPQSWRVALQEWTPTASVAPIEIEPGVWAIVQKEGDDMRARKGASYEGPTDQVVPDGAAGDVAGKETFSGPTGSAVPGATALEDVTAGTRGPGGIMTPAVRTLSGSFKAEAITEGLDLAAELSGHLASILNDDLIADKPTAIKSVFAMAEARLVQAAQKLSTPKQGDDAMNDAITKKLDDILAGQQRLEARVAELEGADPTGGDPAGGKATGEAQKAGDKAVATKDDKPLSRTEKLLVAIARKMERNDERLDRFVGALVGGSRRAYPTTPTLEANLARKNGHVHAFDGAFPWDDPNGGPAEVDTGEGQDGDDVIEGVENLFARQ